MRKTALEETYIDTWLTLRPLRPGADLPHTFRLEADGAYVDHGGKLRIKFKHNSNYSDFDDAMADGHSPLVEYEFILGNDKFQGEGNAVLYQDEVILKDLGKKEMKKIMKSSKVAREIEAIAQTLDNWQGEGCENYDDSQDVCLDKKASPPHSDGKVEAIADYLSNGLEHDGDNDAIFYLQHEFGLRHEIAEKLVHDWLHHFHTKPHATNAEVFPFIESIVYKHAKIGSVNVKISDLLGEYKKLGADDAAVSKLAEKYSVDTKALLKALEQVSKTAAPKKKAPAAGGSGGPAGDDELKAMASEYFILPKEFQKCVGKQLFIHKHGNLDAVLQGMDLMARATCEKIVDKTLIVAKCVKPVPEGHCFLGVVGFKDGVANAYVHKYEDGYAYIGCMGNEVLK